MGVDFIRVGRFEDVARWHVTRFVRRAAGELPAGASVLDAGAGECAYKGLFAHCKYRSIDSGVGDARWDYSHLDYIAPLDRMPIPDGTFDAVLCTQVLEHLEFPRECVAEMCRVLKPGGRLYLTAPMAQGEHQQPYDFFRYTSFGLRSICERAGFENVRIEPFGGICTRWAHELRSMVALFPPRAGERRLSVKGLLGLPLKAAVFVAVRLLQILLLAMDRLDGKRDYPLGWGLVAEKRV